MWMQGISIRYTQWKNDIYPLIDIMKEIYQVLIEKRHSFNVTDLILMSNFHVNPIEISICFDDK